MSRTRFYTPLDAEAAFYAAFERGDVDTMMAVWADDETIICIHPSGPVLVGADQIRASWQQIFRGSSTVKFIVEEKQREHGQRLAVHVVNEFIHVDNLTPPAPMIATNVYRLTDDGWRMVLHHASPSPPPAVEPEKVLH